VSGYFWFTVFYDNVDDDYDDFDDYKIVCYWIQQSCSRMPLFVVMSMLGPTLLLTCTVLLYDIWIMDLPIYNLLMLHVSTIFVVFHLSLCYASHNDIHT